MQQLPLGGTDSITGSTYRPAPQLVPFYQKMFGLYRSTAGVPLAVLGQPRSCAPASDFSAISCRGASWIRSASIRRIRRPSQLATGANSHYHALQTTVEKQLARGLQFQANYTWSHCIDTVSNGGFLPFSAGGILSPIPGNLQRDRGPCDYDVRHNVTASYTYQLPVRVRGTARGRRSTGGRHPDRCSGAAAFHSRC
ncbi:MAG TPA: hypothetical protein VMJ75_12110 [Candidatus Acidoferrales bacterium]|nr:hypothetical protein [Candidatus Acidoferrales bacterium]